MQQVKSFTEEVGRSGKWDGEVLEGFVVRTTVCAFKSSSDAAAPPSYADGSYFFSKVKLDEPYMMYRDWRGITEALLSRGESAKLPKSKMALPETQAYVKWVKGEIMDHPELFDGYTSGHGIIATRERFLKWLERGRGRVIRRRRRALEAAAVTNKKFGKTIIMPIAVPGLGSLYTYFT